MLKLRNEEMKIEQILGFHVPESRIYRLLGADMHPLSRRVRRMVSESIDLLSQVTTPRGIWMRVSSTQRDNSVSLGRNGFTVESRKFATILARFPTAVICAGTLGSGVGTVLSGDAGKRDKMSSKYVLDLVASAAMEACMDDLQDRIAASVGPGMMVTHRYSPGYCDWHIRQQKELFQLLPAAMIGITLSDSLLMHPRKSVTAVMGVGPEEEVAEHGNACLFCGNRKCGFRRTSGLYHQERSTQ